MIETVYWAHIDSEGRIITLGQCGSFDVFMQKLAPGLTAVARPSHVTAHENWKYINDTWVLLD